MFLDLLLVETWMQLTMVSGFMGPIVLKGLGRSADWDPC